VKQKKSEVNESDQCGDFLKSGGRTLVERAKAGRNITGRLTKDKREGQTGWRTKSFGESTGGLRTGEETVKPKPNGAPEKINSQ